MNINYSQTQSFCIWEATPPTQPIPVPTDPCDVRFLEQDWINNNPFGPCYENNTDDIILKVFVHALTLNGTGAQSLSVINQELNNMVKVYGEHGITFSFEGFEYLPVDANTYYVNENNVEHVISLNSSDDRIDIYFCGPGVFDSARAFWRSVEQPEIWNIGNSACVIGGGLDIYTDCGNLPLLPTYVVAHEVGHLLGLLHIGEFVATHPGFNNENWNPNDCYDPNITVPDCFCGDHISETDYYSNEHDNSIVNCLSSNCDCDDPACGLSTPTPSNLMMSVTPTNCRTSLTNDQGNRLKQFISSCDFLSDLKTDRINISPYLEIIFDKPILSCHPEIEVESGAKLSINTPMEFEQSKGITIKGGGTVIIDAVTLSGCNGSTWRGIEVEGSRTTPQIPTVDNGQGHLIIKGKQTNPNDPSTTNTAELLNAEYPIRAVGGARVFAELANFTNCGPVSFSDYRLNNYSQFSGCIFDRDDDFPFSHYAQFRLKNMGAMSISGTTFTNKIIGNNHFAIEAIDSRFSLSSSSVVEGYLTGVMAYSWFNSAFTNFSIRNSTFRGNGTGIAVWSNENFTIRDNIFESIGSFTGASIHNGLMMRRCPSFTVAGNTLKVKKCLGLHRPLAL